MIRILIISVLLFTACSPGIERIEEPDNLIEREKMIPLLTELVKLEAHITTEYNNIMQYHKVMTTTGDSLLKTKGVTKDQFEESMEYYGSRQDEMMGIYNEVLENLNKELGELEGKSKAVDSRK